MLYQQQQQVEPPDRNKVDQVDTLHVKQQSQKPSQKKSSKDHVQQKTRFANLYKNVCTFGVTINIASSGSPSDLLTITLSSAPCCSHHRNVRGGDVFWLSYC